VLQHTFKERILVEVTGERPRQPVSRIL